MKQLLFLICVFFAFESIAGDIFIELGQEFVLKQKVSRVWVENQKVVSVEPAAQGIKIKPLSLGQSRLRLNNETVKVYITPIGSQTSFQEWQKLTKKFVDLHVDFCEELVCLKGKLYQYKEFEKILTLLKKDPSPLYFAAELHPSIISDVQKYLEKYQREKGLTPLRVVFSSPWKVHYGGKDFSSEYKSELAKLGVLAIDSKQKIEIADNIKVSIQVTEVKKEFRRTLGIKYPGTYSAQVLDPDNTKLIPFDVALQANQLDGDVKILASPNLVCRSGKEAEFFAGGEFPIRILNYKVNDVVWKKYGIGLKIKPIIDSVGQMSLQIDSEVSTLDQSTTVDGIPGLQTNKVSSTFDLIRSRTIALSGLIKNEQGQSSEVIFSQATTLKKMFLSLLFSLPQSFCKTKKANYECKYLSENRKYYS
jgi:pilus assembly protein CpaC